MINITFGVFIKNCPIPTLRIIDITFYQTNHKLDCFDNIILTIFSARVYHKFDTIGIFPLINNPLDNVPGC